MILHAHGEFDVALVPLTSERAIPLMARMTNDKVFRGDLTGTSQGEMLSAATCQKDSAGYVSIERVEGTLQGRHGSFFLQHNGIMDRGAGTLTVSVIPDSGTGELSGLRGTLSITMVDGRHVYDFEYSLPE